jgi:hypothetical protein
MNQAQKLRGKLHAAYKSIQDYFGAVPLKTDEKSRKLQGLLSKTSDMLADCLEALNGKIFLPDDMKGE